MARGAAAVALEVVANRSAWSSSMELEWVFPDTPMASSASRIGLLFTSNSRAKIVDSNFAHPSLYRFPTVAPSAVHSSLV